MCVCGPRLPEEEEVVEKRERERRDKERETGRQGEVVQMYKFVLP